MLFPCCHSKFNLPFLFLDLIGNSANQSVPESRDACAYKQAVADSINTLPVKLSKKLAKQANLPSPC